MHDSESRIVVLTGGGTAGHVMPNLAIAPALKKAGFDLVYIGSHGIEENLVRSAGIKFVQIQSGKLRRYFSLENLLDVFRVFAGTAQSFFLMLRIRPACVFSKGGFVAVPVAVGAWLARVPVVSHESDVSPGLANRIISRFASMNLYAFPETSRYFVGRSSRCVGIPVRPEVYSGDRSRGLALCGWSGADAAVSLPVVLFMGGSQGAKFINDLVAESLPELLLFCRVIHLTGHGKMEAPKFSVTQVDALSSQVRDRYKSFEFLNRELPDVMAASDLAVCRAGANSIFEMLAIKKPMILMPLEKGSRGDQILNAASFKHQGWAEVLREADANRDSLVSVIRNALDSRDATVSRLPPGVASEASGQAIIEELNAAIKGPG